MLLAQGIESITKLADVPVLLSRNASSLATCHWPSNQLDV